jgi:hypothetical protein
VTRQFESIQRDTPEGAIYSGRYEDANACIKELGQPGRALRILLEFFQGYTPTPH